MRRLIRSLYRGAEGWGGVGLGADDRQCSGEGVNP